MAFTQTPSLESPITVPELLDFHYEHNPTHPIYVFAQDEQGTTEISYLEFVRACHRLAHIIRPHRTGPERAVVAVVALVDTLVYETIIAGVIRAGLIVSCFFVLMAWGKHISVHSHSLYSFHRATPQLLY